MLVSLKKIRFVVRHGIYEEEHLVPNHFFVNCSVSYSDDFSGELVVDYVKLHQIISGVMHTPAKTLESLVRTIISEIKSIYTFVDWVEVEVEKKTPPFTCDLTSVSVKERG